MCSGMRAGCSVARACRGPVLRYAGTGRVKYEGSKTGFGRPSLATGFSSVLGEGKGGALGGAHIILLVREADLRPGHTAGENTCGGLGGCVATCVRAAVWQGPTEARSNVTQVPARCPVRALEDQVWQALSCHRLL